MALHKHKVNNPKKKAKKATTKSKTKKTVRKRRVVAK